MKKFGDFWIPDLDARLGRHWLKSRRVFARGHGPKVEAPESGSISGAYSRVMMERFEVVHAFEPAPDTYACLVKNLEAWGAGDRVRPQQKALSDRKESGSLAPKPSGRSPSRRVVGGGDIPSVRIDDLGLEDLAFLKLDVEGYEERALRGAEETLARFQPLVMIEDKPRKSAHFDDPRGAHDYLEGLGMKPVACVGPKQIDWIYGF